MAHHAPAAPGVHLGRRGHRGHRAGPAAVAVEPARGGGPPWRGRVRTIVVIVVIWGAPSATPRRGHRRVVAHGGGSGVAVQAGVRRRGAGRAVERGGRVRANTVHRGGRGPLGRGRQPRVGGRGRRRPRGSTRYQPRTSGLGVDMLLLLLLSGRVLVKGRVEVTLQMPRAREPLVAGLALIRLDAFHILVRLAAVIGGGSLEPAAAHGWPVRVHPVAGVAAGGPVVAVHVGGSRRKTATTAAVLSWMMGVHWVAPHHVGGGEVAAAPGSTRISIPAHGTRHASLRPAHGIGRGVVVPLDGVAVEVPDLLRGGGVQLELARRVRVRITEPATPCRGRRG